MVMIQIDHSCSIINVFTQLILDIIDYPNNVFCGLTIK